MESKEGIYESIAVLRVGSVLGDESSHKYGSVDEHVLARCGGAQAVSLSPVGSCLVISLLLVILFVVGHVLYALSTVRTPLALRKHIA